METNYHVNLFGSSDQQLAKLVTEYCRLVTQPELSSQDAQSITEILSYSRYDQELNYWLCQADQLIDYQLSTGAIPDYDLVVSSLSIKNLAYNLTRVPSHQVTFETFKELVTQTKLKHRFLDQYISFDEQHFSRKAIFQTTALTIYMIGWRPGQGSTAHHHGQSLDAIFVYKGEMTHRFPNQDEGLEPDKMPSRPGELFGENQVVCIDRKQYHLMANNSSKDLVTLHFRFGTPPDNINWQTNISECKPAAIWSNSNEDMEEICRLMIA
ncbi:MAG: hypothetical protein F6K50_29480 [Moorea sp. SIO3I7]|uniref:cysteine dioxygenase n=1 Tax=Moorena sp. SIO3I8 TaxID=2607833 RepID=UPI0013C105FB|nr:cysteine dioxygenase family protein [Moorena sp. SIO3I8]NEN99465.1 hypothetical protein [Moorena sp. SIO3I7]NEO07366.1 hypothetical protein [Moorena sp. SIO3I8]